MRNKKPLIGVTVTEEDGFIKMRPCYAECISDAGGLPVFLPYTADEKRIAEYAEILDGVLFTGGVDIDPKYYGEAVAFDSVEINAARDAFEFALFREFFKTGKPILGICRGHQLLNVAIGGSLYQHMEGHRQTDGLAAFNRLSIIKEGTRLYTILGVEKAAANSFHHQSVKTTGEGLTVSATADDGVIEAIELPTHKFFIGVQWHPERFYKQDEPAARLFKAFVDAAKE